jgi:hypothetical protein
MKAGRVALGLIGAPVVAGAAGWFSLGGMASAPAKP